ncbi:MAG: glutathione S-transferase family protein [Gammaproteobacteria bacterium]|nr:glutathione S-transferase family protein [Gammaproteobacteria bacterium]
MSEIILHHYPQSPVAEKVRTVLGIKQLAWRSVEIPRLPPKPELVPLTGGYRRTPVMQIGADVYCDSQCIIRELQDRHPEPTLYPHDGAGMVWALSRWTDGPLFTLAIAVVFGSQVDTLPADFANDRGRLYFGPHFELAALGEALPHSLAQLRAQLGWIDERLATGRAHLLGSQPGLPDALCYHIVWFIRGRYAGAAGLLAQFAHLEAWERRMQAIGHGTPRDMTAAEALDVARDASPLTAEHADASDSQGLAPGQQVEIVPETDSGDPSVAGTVVHVSANRIAIAREDPRVGGVTVHFPRVGYVVRRR